MAALAAQCVWGGRRRWDLIMRYGQLFTPGTAAGGGAYPKKPLHAGRNAYRWAMESGLLYAEGYACPRGGVPAHSAWCLDGETVVDPGSSEPGTAYFGVALRSDYMRRNYEAHRYADGTDGFRQLLRVMTTRSWTRRWIRPPTSSGTSAATFRPGCASGV